ncbi:unnamed protein product [Tetraodon nigroviridis]|uniref:(spotted green pufferfish) hypothetical protein n=1 Tax=Tetraodon nigroviridis TaxID=99883 RepID=Q4SD01_TETNG|nr:unnamed protein product [Tetraodon nigroviridis]
MAESSAVRAHKVEETGRPHAPSVRECWNALMKRRPGRGGSNEIERWRGIRQGGCSGWGLSDQVFSINCGGWPGSLETARAQDCYWLRGCGGARHPLTSSHPGTPMNPLPNSIGTASPAVMDLTRTQHVFTCKMAP